MSESNYRATPRQIKRDELPDPAQTEAIDSAFVENRERDGRPKTIVRDLPIRGGSGEFVAGIISCFEAAGARVLDATGTTPRDKRRVAFRESQFDVVVGIQGCWRVRTGCIARPPTAWGRGCLAAWRR